MSKNKTSTLTQKLVTKLAGDITGGKLEPGAQLPSEEALGREFHVSRVTVRRSLARLRDQHLLISRAGVGHFVAPGAGLNHDCTRTEVIYVHNVGSVQGAFTPSNGAIFQGVLTEADHHGLDVFHCCLGPARLRKIISDKKGHGLAGVLFDWNDHDLASFMIDEQIPFVVVEGDFDDLPVGAVVQDDAGGTNAALAYLASQGHTRLGFIGYRDSWVHSRKRQAAFREFHLRHGLPLNDTAVSLADFVPEEDGYRSAAELFHSKDCPTALFLANAELLPGVIRAAGEQQIRIPRDLSIVTWGQPEPSLLPYIPPFITWDRQKMGQLALRLLHDRSRRNAMERMQVLIPTQLVAGPPDTTQRSPS